MAKLLLLTVQLHDGRYHGRGEFPPAPARLFQALIAGAGLSGPSVLDQFTPALRWLETLRPPVIAAPRARRGQEFNSFVPQNDLDRYGGDVRQIGKIRTAKVIQPLFCEVIFRYAWWFEGDAGHANAICSLAERLYQFGRGEDMAWAWGEILEGSEMESRIAEDGGATVYRPSGAGRGTALACPTKGSLQSLKDRYRLSGARYGASPAARGGTRALLQPPRQRFAEVAYNSPAVRRVYALHNDNDGSAVQTWPLISALPLVTAIRDDAAARLRQALASRASEIERVFVGRKANGDDDAPVSSRVRLIPLPSIGHPRADRGIRRVLVEVPAECPFRSDDVHWALSGLELTDPATGQALSTTLIPEATDTMLTHYGIEAEFRTWRTVTPAALPGWVLQLRREQDPVGDSTEARLARLQRAAEAITKTLRFSGVRAPVASVRVQREPFESRGERSDAFDVGTRFSKRVLWHVELVFGGPVAGPLAIGDGRFMGLGVMAPVREEPERASGAVGGAFVTPHAVRQFQERIAPLPYNQALAAILHSLKTASPVKSAENGVAEYVRTRLPYRFRAYLREPLPGRVLPAVVTILKG